MNGFFVVRPADQALGLRNPIAEVRLLYGLLGGISVFGKLICLIFGCRTSGRWHPLGIGNGGPLYRGHCIRCGKFFELPPIPPRPKSKHADYRPATGNQSTDSRPFRML